MTTNRKNKQKLNTYATDDETEEKLFKVVMIRSQNAGKTISKSAVIRALIHEALEWETSDETP